MGREKNFKGKSKYTQFSSTNQPDPKLISKGHKRGQLIKKIASQIVKGGVREDLIPLAEYLGVDPDKIDLETLLHLTQMHKAIKEGDTSAYNAIMNRILGKPTEFVEIKSKGNSLDVTILNSKKGK